MLPEIIITCVGNKFVPGWEFPVEIFRVGVGEGAEAEIEIVNVKPIEVETEILVRRFQQSCVFKGIAEPERPIVKEVVPQPSVAHTSLLGDGLEGGMRIDHSHRHQESVVRNSIETHAPIVIWNIFYEPINGVVSVRALVDAFRE